jgi:hypothetical protein
VRFRKGDARILEGLPKARKRHPTGNQFLTEKSQEKRGERKA